MELDGHPTHDMLEELQARGAIVYPGTSSGPDPERLRMTLRQEAIEQGLWLFLPGQAFNTGFDEPLA
jgi:hypothetical protein